MDYLTGKVEANADGLYDHGGYEISQSFVDDILDRNFYDGLNIYTNDLLLIHGTEDTTVPFEISKIYVPKFINTAKFIPIKEANHNFDKVEQIKKVLRLSLEFLCS
ncbi:alpha/beta hydrolase [Thomasclavelia cocleata]|uniref:alpha/beta hydrolase n=1 Tax=Thomasclavelia cocleata TaxID=69824 RepID=UPI00255AEA17|nr:alpha/beta hydrolase [Thomasclavelia cocleata]